MNRPTSLLVTAALMSAVMPPAAWGDPTAEARFIEHDQSPIGTAGIVDTPSGVRIRVRLSGLTPGWHAIHIHETGRCDTPDFTDAGAHLGHDQSAHGHVVATGPHMGDLPNIFAAADGVAEAELFSERLTLDPSRVSATRGLASGKAIIVHAGSDDDVTQPSGGAGARVACALIPGR